MIVDVNSLLEHKVSLGVLCTFVLWMLLSVINKFSETLTVLHVRRFKSFPACLLSFVCWKPILEQTGSYIDSYTDRLDLVSILEIIRYMQYIRFTSRFLLTLLILKKILIKYLSFLTQTILIYKFINILFYY